MAERARCIAIVGAESTGKTQLSLALAGALRTRTGQRVACVPELLRAWCEREGRTPRQAEQAGILQAQHAQIEAAVQSHDWVVCDTTALMTAVYSQLVFGDDSLRALAGEWHRHHARQTLLTALDLPWVPDGLQRDGPQVRAPVDARVRAALADAGLGFSVVAGHGNQRVHNALALVQPLLG